MPSRTRRLTVSLLLGALIAVLLAVTSPSAASALRPTECDYNATIIYGGTGCFTVEGTVLVGDEPLAGVFVAVSPEGGRMTTGSDGRFSLPVLFGDASTSYVLELRTGSMTRSEAFSFRVSMVLPLAADETMIELPPLRFDLTEIDVVVEANCGDRVPLGGCEPVDIAMTAVALADSEDVLDLSGFSPIGQTFGGSDPRTIQAEGRSALVSEPFVGTGTMAVFTSSENTRISFDPVDETLAGFGVVWDGSNPFIVRAPNIEGRIRTAAPNRPILRAEDTASAATGIPVPGPAADSAEATAPPAEAPKELAFTGASSRLATSGLLSVLAGVCLMQVSHRRQRSSGA